MKAGIALVLLGTGVALAEPPRGALIRVPPPQIVAPHDGPSSRIIFLHRCMSGGCPILAGGIDDSRTNHSQIAAQDTVISEFTQNDATWNGLVSCMRATYAPFNVVITDEDPGRTVPHYEHIVGGQPGELRPDISNAGGVAPGTCGDLPNGISFTFDRYGNDVDNLCWTAAQETAHVFGLDHELNGSDPMTYLRNGPSRKSFQPQSAFCGESNPRDCLCPNTDQQQNSYEMIMTLFGPGIPSPPQVSIKSPSDGTTVQPHFVVRVKAMDDVLVDRVELWIDGVSTGVVSSEEPYRLVAPDGIDEGPHHVEVKAYDIQNSEAVAALDVDLGPPCTQSTGCTDGEVCTSGVCTAGPGDDGGIGFRCQQDADCIDGNCVKATDGSELCTATCTENAECPGGFECLTEGGVCWPVEAGCCSTGGDPRGAIVGGLLVAVVLRRRKSQRATEATEATER